MTVLTMQCNYGEDQFTVITVQQLNYLLFRETLELFPQLLFCVSIPSENFCHACSQTSHLDQLPSSALLSNNRPLNPPLPVFSSLFVLAYYKNRGAYTCIEQLLASAEAQAWATLFGRLVFLPQNKMFVRLWLTGYNRRSNQELHSTTYEDINLDFSSHYFI